VLSPANCASMIALGERCRENAIDQLGPPVDDMAYPWWKERIVSDDHTALHQTWSIPSGRPWAQRR
jgi:hypothetical protein